jgi:hypothetical protein
MVIAGIMPVKNEDWILGFTARAALMWVDHLVILLHACGDDSWSIAQRVAKEHPNRVWIFSSDDEGWPEMVHRQALLELAISCDGPRATHIALIDADEVLSANLLPLARELFHRTPNDAILQVPYYYLRGPAGLYHTNGIWKPRVTSLGFQYQPGLCWKGDMFHHREPMGLPLRAHIPIAGAGAGGVLHYWAADERRHKAKHALYKITERLRWPNKAIPDIEKYYGYATRPLLGEPPWTYAVLPDHFLAVYGELLTHVHYNEQPWQEAECQRLVALHGRDLFLGLDLLGVI